MKIKGSIFKYCALAITLSIMLSALSSCAKDNKTVVGTVNGQDVYYDELYFLVSNYKDSVAEKCENDPTLMQEELDTLIKENIVSNFAILELCKRNGLEYEDIEDKIDDQFDLFITENFNGDKSEFRKSCKEFGLSERYVRYTLGVELLYEQLPNAYVEGNKVLTKEADIITHIKKNFIHVNHLVIFNDEGDDPAANLAKITQAKAELDNGTPMNTLIGRGFSEDFGDPDASGYYITHGAMIEDYESAAFSLEVGEYSDIISTYSENNFGEYVSCYYIIQRLDMSDDYISTYFTELKNDYYGGIIYSDLEKIEKELQFVPNKAYEELDLTDLPESTSYSSIALIAGISTGVAIIVAIVVLLIIKHNLKKKNQSYKAKRSGRKA